VTWCAILACPTLAASSGGGRANELGTLFVVVTDAGSRPIYGARIDVEASGGTKAAATTGPNGSWGFALPQGDYRVVVSKAGYRQATIYKRLPDTVNVTVMFNLAADTGGPYASGFYAWAGVLGAVVAIAAISLIVKRRKAKKAAGEAKRNSRGPVAADEAGEQMDIVAAGRRSGR
jgi:hypothetical protein